MKGLPKVSILGGSTQPPSTKSVRNALFSYLTEEGMGILLQAGWRSAAIPVERPRRPPAPNPDPKVKAEMAALKEAVPDQRRFLAARGFFGDYAIEGRAWDGNKLDAAQLTLASTPVKLPDIASKQALLTSLKDIRTQVVHGKGRLAEIVAQAEHASLFFALTLDMALISHDFTLDLVDAVNDVVVGPVYGLKHVLRLPRPSEFNSDMKGHEVVPWLPNPVHLSYPSGHAALAYALDVVLSELTGATTLSAALTEHLAKNRERAGVHSSLDTKAGEIVGRAIGRWMVNKARKPSPEFYSWAALFALASEEWK